MDIEWLRKVCLSLPGTSEEIKWGNDLCFMVARKMFCVTGLEQNGKIAFKVTDQEFEELSSREGFIPAPYMARAKWVMVLETGRITKNELERYIRQSYELVKGKLTKKIKNQFGIT